MLLLSPTRLLQVHRRCAERLRDGCLANGGLYVKLGQGLAAMNHLLPEEYLSTLSYLNDKALTRPDRFVGWNYVMVVVHGGTRDGVDVDRRAMLSFS